MCIRDIPYRAYGTGGGGLQPAAAKTFSPNSDGVEDNFIPCLLYTSDAADERSSVDLGGRRILKKKKLKQRRRADTPYKQQLK